MRANSDAASMYLHAYGVWYQRACIRSTSPSTSTHTSTRASAGTSKSTSTHTRDSDSKY